MPESMFPDFIQTILDAGAKNAAEFMHTEIDGVLVPFVRTPSGVEPCKNLLAVADERADAPRRRRGVATVQALDSLIAHVQRFKSPDSAIFADAAGRKIVAVLDYHPAGASAGPAWGDHRTLYACPLSPEWQRWGGGTARTMSQDQLVAFLDASDRDLHPGAEDADGKAYPTPSELMTMAATLEAFSTKKSTRTRSETGAKLEFTSDEGVKSPVAIPRAFAIRIPVFSDSAPEAVEVRLRVEVKDGAPVFTLAIHDPEKVLRAAFEKLVKRVEDGTGCPVFIGTPEA